MTDHPKVWRAMLTRLAPTLPGEWRVRGSGQRAVVAREPVEWTLAWLGMSRTRKTDDPYLMAGVTSLVGPVMGLTSEFGLRSDEVRPRPSYRTVSLQDDDLEGQVRTFFLQDAWPLMERGTYQAHADRAEQQLAQPAADREPPWAFPDAAGWRVVLGTGSPVEPARQAVEKFGSFGAGDMVGCYEALISAWESGGRPAALGHLLEQRDATLSRLTLS